jgi:putative glutamine amidotransferase
MKKPIVGITVSIDHGKRIRPGFDYLYIKRAYSQSVRKAGGQPLLISPEIDPQEVSDICDAIIISGGDDLPPELYGEQVDSPISLESPERIQWELQLLDVFGKAERPILGVCYGMQLINVHFGGTLHQDLSSLYKEDHGGGGRITSHRLKVNEESFLFPLLGRDITVSSSHHQGIKNLAPEFRVAAVSNDNVIEAVERRNIIAVEWHPETDDTGEAIYSYFVKRSRESRKE